VSGDAVIVVEISPAPEPLDAFRRLEPLPYVLFLDSVTAGAERAHYSFLAARPFEVVVARGGRVSVMEEEQRGLSAHAYREAEAVDGDPLQALGRRLVPWRGPRLEGLPPFQGGAAGLLGYGLSRSIEKLPAPRRDEFEVPDLAFGFYGWVLGFDHERGTCHLVAHGFPERDRARAQDLAAARVREVRSLLARGESAAPSRPRPRSSRRSLARSELAPQWPLAGKDELLSCFSEEDYVGAVARAVEYVRAGDIFQVNLSQRLLYPQTCPPLDLYLRLRETNPAPFAAYFDLGELVLASSSPEQFLSLAGGEVVTRPIKGTRSRGYCPEEDVFRRDLLLASEKDRAENVMIVDLLRNDLSRVSLPHSVQVPRLFEIERFATVQHLVSEVRARLRPDTTALDLLRAAFPGGSVTGAPKVRAMEIIAEIEPVARGAYCGSLGWIAFHGDMGTSILIRTVTCGRGWLQFGAGGGIVADSDPRAEYQETLDKAAGIVRALE
jgi:para-aminobenzoate synthetase component 1